MTLVCISLLGCSTTYFGRITWRGVGFANQPQSSLLDNFWHLECAQSFPCYHSDGISGCLEHCFFLEREGGMKSKHCHFAFK